MRYLERSAQTRATGERGKASGRERSRAPLFPGRRGYLGGVFWYNLHMETTTILNQLANVKSYIASQYGVKKIGIFGSVVNGRATTTSDIDIYVEFEQKNFRNIVGLIAFLEKLLHKKVDLLYPHKNADNNIITTIKKEVVYV